MSSLDCVPREYGRFHLERISDAQRGIVDVAGSVVGVVDTSTFEARVCNREPVGVPIVLVTGDVAGDTGLVKVWQPDGSYRRMSRWDRIERGTPAKPNAILRTLPQCGCGGALGMPQLFDSFVEMSAYFFCVFGLSNVC